jgi:hypothetical protein
VCGGDEPLSCVIDQDDVVDSNGVDHAAVKVTVGRGEHHVFPSVFGVKQPISQRPAASRSGACRRLLSVEGVIESVSQRTAEPD